MKNSFFWIISYDIKDNKRRNCISQELKNHGSRVQYSVFECLLPNEKAKKLINKLAGMISPKKDSIRFYKLCESCHSKIQVCGTGKLTEDKEVYIL
ncbi:MAG: CRISPR-associated endonuclease Cas2 [Promethearchaeota archaeon]